LVACWIARGWSVTLHDAHVYVDTGIDRIEPIVWQPANGRVRIPGDPGVFKAHDPEQFVLLLSYGADRLKWQAEHGQLPHLAKNHWSEMARVHFPPWDPIVVR
jgi:hypothetical protein